MRGVPGFAENAKVTNGFSDLVIELWGDAGVPSSHVAKTGPKSGAPVSTPLRWDEITEDVTPRRFGMREALERVEQHGDLFGPVLAGGQPLGSALKKLR